MDARPNPGRSLMARTDEQITLLTHTKGALRGDSLSAFLNSLNSQLSNFDLLTHFKDKVLNGLKSRRDNYSCYSNLGRVSCAPWADYLIGEFERYGRFLVADRRYVEKTKLLLSEAS